MRVEGYGVHRVDPTFPGAENSILTLSSQVRSLQIKGAKKKRGVQKDKTQLLATEKGRA